MTKKQIRVAVGLLRNFKKELLVSRNRAHMECCGQWEFPGGKFEMGESGFAALFRELKEELGIQVYNAKRFLKYEYEYPQYICFFEVWLVNAYRGKIFGAEGQKIRWLNSTDLIKAPILDGSKQIVDSILKTNYF